MQHGYHQIKMRECDIPKRSSVPPWGQYEYLSMPFSLTMSLRTFQCIVSRILKDIPDIPFFLDDILISSINEREHTNILKETFEAITKNNVKLNLKNMSSIKTKLNISDT